MRELVYCLILAIPFGMMELFIRQLAREINYKNALYPPSLLFSVIWMMLFVIVPLNLKQTIGRIIYSICFSIFFIAFLTNCIYFPYTGLFFSFNLLELAGEGSAYIKSTLLSTSPFIYVFAFVILVIGIVIIKKFPKREKNNFPILVGTFALFMIGHLLIPFLYGEVSDNLKWDAWYNPRNVYENFNDSNKSIKACGFYEYICRDFYMTFIKTNKEVNSNEIEFLDAEFADMETHEQNEYTGMFEGKNLILLQLEGIDTWLFNEEDMPNLYGLLENSMNFEEHYSYYTGGGSTFNSEFAVNTGFITPISYIQNAYTFNANEFPYAMPNLFDELGYEVNAFHMNEGEYYSRRLNYQSWGYDDYYSLLETTDYNDISYELDRELILNETFYEEMFCQDKPFMNYIITYTTHMPYEETSGKGLYLASEEYGEEIPDLTEEECARMYAGETDEMVGLLLDALKKNELLENTVIVAFADHYLYTLSDKTILEKYKQTENNLINNTPFFIWSYGMEAKTFDKVNSQLDILPTVLNLFGIEYEEEYYIGNDIFDEEYTGYVFFSDYSWYDGTVYVQDAEVKNDVEFEEDDIEEMNTHINELIKKNDWVLKYDYFEELEDSQ